MSDEIKWRELTLGESLATLKRHLERENIILLRFANHRKMDRLGANIFRFTIQVISLDFVINLMEDESVKNVYFHPSSPPPGSGIDSISMRYKVYVEYHEVEDAE